VKALCEAGPRRNVELDAVGVSQREAMNVAVPHRDLVADDIVAVMRHDLTVLPRFSLRKSERQCADAR